MSLTRPYTHYSCPCTNITGPLVQPGEALPQDDADDDQDQTFNPHSARANYALYPIENLLFCNECHEIRCPRCYYDESLYYFCPSCLLETPSATVKSESNRCTRSCFQCPICIAPLALQSFQAADDARSKPEQPAMRDGPFILSCPYCTWSTLEIGIKFDKSINISGQLARLKNGGQVTSAPQDVRGSRAASITEADKPIRSSNPDDQFANLVSFYRNELAETAPGGPLSLSSSFGLDSPSTLTRLLNTYGVGGLKKQRSKPQPMREAANFSEGLVGMDDDEAATIERMRRVGWDGMTSVEQRAQQSNKARFLTDVRPIATPLRSKRAKRCRTCRQHLIRPEEKRQSTRYKIRLLALTYVPRITVKPMDPSADLSALAPSKASQFLLTFRNPLFDPVKIHLATPRTTPGPVASRVTILCPQFDIGASTDVWDEALDASGDRPRAREPEGQQAEAGKVWAKGRNWTAVILEVVPGATLASALDAAGKSDEQRNESASTDGDDRDLLEVPVLVRMEYLTDATSAEVTGQAAKDQRIARELEFWVVVGLGRIALPHKTAAANA